MNLASPYPFFLFVIDSIKSNPKSIAIVALDNNILPKADVTKQLCRVLNSLNMGECSVRFSKQPLSLHCKLSWSSYVFPLSRDTAARVHPVIQRVRGKWVQSGSKRSDGFQRQRLRCQHLHFRSFPVGVWDSALSHFCSAYWRQPGVGSSGRSGEPLLSGLQVEFPSNFKAWSHLGVFFFHFLDFFQSEQGIRLTEWESLSLFAITKNDLESFLMLEILTVFGSVQHRWTMERYRPLMYRAGSCGEERASLARRMCL